MMLLSTALLPHGTHWSTTRIQNASLNHSLWLHAQPDFSDWMLYSLDSPWAGGGRALCRGSIFDRAGKLVASVAQEGLLRLRCTDLRGRDRMGQKPTAGFIGLGDQGAPIARRIVEAGYPLTIWARREASTALFSDTRSEVAATPAALAADCDIIGISVVNDRDGGTDGRGWGRGRGCQNGED